MPVIKKIIWSYNQSRTTHNTPTQHSMALAYGELLTTNFGSPKYQVFRNFSLNNLLLNYKIVLENSLVIRHTLNDIKQKRPKILTHSPMTSVVLEDTRKVQEHTLLLNTEELLLAPKEFLVKLCNKRRVRISIQCIKIQLIKLLNGEEGADCNNYDENSRKPKECTSVRTCGLAPPPPGKAIKAVGGPPPPPGTVKGKGSSKENKWGTNNIQRSEKSNS